jgi:hypothetical protein
VAQAVSVTATVHCHHRAKVTADNAGMNECGCVPVKLYEHCDLNFL